MHMTCDADNRIGTEKEVEHLSVFAPEQHVILAIGCEDNIEPWIIGRAAGFSGGTTTDESKRRSNWASAVSKATRKNRQTLPHIVALQEQLRRFRSDGGEPQSISWKDKLERCEWLILYGTPSESLRAVELHNKMQGLNDSTLSPEEIVRMTVAHAGLEKARIGIEALWPNLLYFVDKIDPIKVQATALQELNSASVDFDDRLEKLEARA